MDLRLAPFSLLQHALVLIDRIVVPESCYSADRYSGVLCEEQRSVSGTQCISSLLVCTGMEPHTAILCMGTSVGLIGGLLDGSLDDEGHMMPRPPC